jgi:ubiquitin thioesterase OTU1
VPSLFGTRIVADNSQSLRIDRFNEERPTRCILVYSGIHYDTIVQSPSEPPYTKADAPPELDKRVWDADDDEIMAKAQELCKKLQAQHYFTDTGGMAVSILDDRVVVRPNNHRLNATNVDGLDTAKVRHLSMRNRGIITTWQK